LQHWLLKIQHASSGYRINEPDAVQASNFYDYVGAIETFQAMPRIPSILDPWGKIDTGSFEECLVYSIRLCRHLQTWDSFERRKALWKSIHTPSVNMEWLSLLEGRKPA
jgi:hypothetical protein